jgi:CheY-like chemotaxis protein
MDTKPRILLVEDRETARKTWVKALTREGFKVDGVANAAEAIEAANKCSYHVAVIDIMLAGDDTSNRDGVEVVRYLRLLRENTEPLVLSGQTDTTLVRDLLREYGAIDYLAKKEIEQKGLSILIEKVRSLLEPPSATPKISDWHLLVKTLAGDSSEEVFVSLCLRSLKFKGAFENLSTSLLMACKHLVPLLPPTNTGAGIGPSKVPDVLSGTFWSKGQGAAVELIIYGTSASPERIEAEWNLAERTTLYNRDKAGLSIVVLECPHLLREEFSSFN